MNKSSIISQIIIITLIFGLVYIIFSTTYFNIFGINLLNSYIFISSILVFFTYSIARHLIKIKVLFLNIFLQTILSQNSFIYRLLSRGYLIRILAIIISIVCSIKILIFLCTIRNNLLSFIVFYIGFILFWFIKSKKVNEFGNILRQDVASTLKIYLIPFILSIITSFFVSIVNIYEYNNIPDITSMNDIFQIPIDQIDPDKELYIRPLRAVLRYIYSYELMLKQIINIKIIGYIFYTLYLIISDGFFTFFGIFLSVMPLKYKHD